MKRFFAFAAALFLAVAVRAQSSNTPAASTETGAPAIAFDSTTYQFGKVTQGDPIEHDFVISNTGSATLDIIDVHPSCGCTTAGTWPHELAPGKSGIIPIKVNSKNLSNAIKKSVTITSNDPLHHTSVLQIIGTVTKPIDINPPNAVVKIVAGDTNPPPTTIRISNHTGKPMKLAAASNEPGAFSIADIKTLADTNEFEVTILANPPYLHTTNTAILLATGLSNYTVRIPAYLLVTPAISIQPRAITLPQTVQRDTTFKIGLSSVRPADRFSDPEVTDDRISVTLTNLSVGTPIYTLAAVIPAGFHTTPGKPTHITVKTTDPSSPVVTINVVQVNYNFGGQPPAAAFRARQPLPAISSSSAATAPATPPAPAAH